mgnify:CR=1 FL=1
MGLFKRLFVGTTFSENVTNSKEKAPLPQGLSAHRLKRGWGEGETPKAPPILHSPSCQLCGTRVTNARLLEIKALAFARY